MDADSCDLLRDVFGVGDDCPEWLKAELPGVFDTPRREEDVKAPTHERREELITEKCRRGCCCPFNIEYQKQFVFGEHVHIKCTHDCNVSSCTDLYQIPRSGSIDGQVHVKCAIFASRNRHKKKRF